MNLSLIITIVLIAIVIPWLWRQLFPSQSVQEVKWFEPSSPGMKDSNNEKILSDVSAKTTESFFNDAISVLPTQSVLSDKLFIREHQRDLLAQHQFYTIQVEAGVDQVFIGYDLLQALQNSGFEYGAGEIFHFYANGESDEILFSVASSTKPMTFDLQSIGKFSTKALTLFIDRASSKDPEAIYPLMRERAMMLAEELGGDAKES